ncbi:uncharacterized protein LY89DRAFT_685779 [Mollisia scopiformis]|uniref:K Homology domain-containing protein n=1 Tax=Mollisia scopiformis TaxID=149040 RepID=A0A194X7T8_MOLSC|nr:uncharacterized protein LY89DRAFT_685779 [Mollisia scopiformis]KUJ15877.1 hypothetical protein LY89DRAFT_685779 [Mollisia scopiformis]
MMKKIRFQEATEYAHLLKWAGGNAPAFKLISLAPPAPPGKVYEVLHLHHHEVRALVRKNHALMREFESQTNCKITISREWKLQPDKEIGLFGYRENVEEAKKVILGRQRS